MPIERERERKKAEKSPSSLFVVQDSGRRFGKERKKAVREEWRREEKRNPLHSMQVRGRWKTRLTVGPAAVIQHQSTLFIEENSQKKKIPRKWKNADNSKKPLCFPLQKEKLQGNLHKLSCHCVCKEWMRGASIHSCLWSLESSILAASPKPLLLSEGRKTYEKGREKSFILPGK